MFHKVMASGIFNMQPHKMGYNRFTFVLSVDEGQFHEDL